MKVLMDIQSVALNGKWIRLEPLEIQHHGELSRIALDPELWRWTVTLIRTPDDVRSYIREALRLRDDGYAVPYVMRSKSDGRLVGSTRFANIDRLNRRVEIGWTWIARTHQGTAVNTEAKYLMLKYAFEEGRCNRIELKTDVLNERSRAALKRIGATEEGVLRQHVITAMGRIRDTIYYSVLADEWPVVRARLETMLDRPSSSNCRAW